jgi:GTP-binding protein
MKFVDQAVIQVRSGAGGNGCLSFRREKNVPKGGPNGGDGGNGGNVYLVATSQKDTLYRFHLNQHFRAERGQLGRGKNQHGRTGDDLIIELPLGTTVKDVETDALLVDLAKPGQRFMVARGGRGGRGNARFATSTNRAPRRVEPGEDGQEIKLNLELSLLADVGLIGLPNVGKSTLLSRLSAARPEIADYPFTTLIPCLGVVALDLDRSFVMADLPGLIENAAKGAGLGHRFLKHVQRCRLLLHMLDSSRINPTDPLADFWKINEELAAFSPDLAKKKQFLAINKMDLMGGEAAQFTPRIKAFLPEMKIFEISAVTGQGLDTLKAALFEAVIPDEEDEAAWEI